MLHSNAYSGFGLVELIIALGLFLVVVSVGAVGMIGSLSAQARSESSAEARAVAQETLEATAAIRFDDWSNLTIGTHGLDSNSGSWQFSGTSDQSGKFSRSVHLTAVQRDGSGSIVETGGSTDADTIKATAEVTWNDASGQSRSFSLERYFTRWDKIIPVGSGVPAKFCGTDSTLGSNLTQATAAPVVWNYQSYNDAEYSYSSGNPTRITIDEPGDYVVGVQFPFIRSDSQGTRTRIATEIRKNGVLVTGGVAQSSYIRNANDHTQSSNTVFLLLPQLTIGDYLEVFVQGVADTTNVTVNMDGQGCVMLKQIESSETVFAATSTSATGGNLNTPSGNELEWSEQRKDAGYTHSDSSAPETITVQDAGDYFLSVNIPLTSNSSRVNLLCRVLINGSPQTIAQCAQGYIRDSNGDTKSSIHWSGVLSIPAGAELEVMVEREASGGNVDFDGAASMYMQKLPSTGVAVLTGTQLISGSNWNPSSPSTVNWQTQSLFDSQVYTHSTSSNPNVVTFLENGTYFVSFTTSVTSNNGRPNITARLLKNGFAVSGAVTSPFYIRGSSDHDTSSGNMVYVLEDIQVNDTLQVEIAREADSDSFSSNSPAQLVLWKQ